MKKAAVLCSVRKRDIRQSYVSYDHYIIVIARRGEEVLRDKERFDTMPGTIQKKLTYGGNSLRDRSAKRSPAY
jgi:hypothetical protein